MNERPSLARAVPVSFTLNGIARSVASAPGERLSDVVRRGLGLTGTKVGCNAGDCGACTVLMDGAQVCACMIAATQADGRAIVSIEGLSDLPIGCALQSAFHRHDAAQCGICTPGMLMAAADVLARHASPDRKTIMDALGGVLCRCTGYLKIVEAVLDARKDRSEDARGTGSGACLSTCYVGWTSRAPDRWCTQAHRCGHLRRRRRPGRCPLAEGGPFAPRARTFFHRRPRPVPASQSWHRPRFHSPRCTGRKLLRHLSRSQGPAGFRRSVRALPR